MYDRKYYFKIFRVDFQILQSILSTILTERFEDIKIKKHVKKGLDSTDFTTNLSNPNNNIHIMMLSYYNNKETHIYVGKIDENNKKIIQELIDSIDKEIEKYNS
jgi:hypothetical protein